ncbi:hypothetical protein [Bifidobacterium gallicum]|uniref:Integral membrane transport protein n=1 Tax=Bifidobacterium gallicum DSM 20093 = LMG 11596 TaxID=561180 RepID=D1NV15_9BIFI|nr:hypothetical protein [Bifidobacterium gallicum]EFA22666.1 hypothetical protein BIFGAL_03693 [Bifidobacterium gallicum DSM 20093 = LMG 11596]KFI59629.1 integral membrane transport protein [Bifidobacterium gallicum DSM 20093 = LMG 11596]
MIATLTRLRWALTLRGFSTSPWQIVAYVLAAVAGLSCVAGALLAGLILGNGPRLAGDDATWTQVVRIVMVCGGTFVLLLVALLQIMLLGEGSSMNLKKFEIYGIPDSRLQLGLTVAGVCGLPAIMGMLLLLCWAPGYRWMGAGAVISGCIAAPLVIITLMCMCKAVLSLSTTLVRSQRGRNLFYVILTLAVVVSAQIPGIVLNNEDTLSVRMSDVEHLTNVLGWLPLGSLFELPFDAQAGRWGAWIVRIVIAAAFSCLCFLVSVWCIRRERLLTDPTQGYKTAKGIGMFAHVPDSPSGAITARAATQLRRDPRQGMLFVFPVLFIAIFALESHGFSVIVWQSLIWIGWILCMPESNSFPYDGRGFAMEVITGTSGKQDRVGRVRLYLVILAVLYVLMGIATFLVTGDWKSADGIALGLTFTLSGFATALAALGVAEWFSTVFLYPVASIDKPFSSPQGRAAAQGFFPFLYMLIALVAMVPTIAVAIIAMLMHWQAWALIISSVALLNGIGILVLGTWLGARMFDARELKILHTLEDFASLQK